MIKLNLMETCENCPLFDVKVDINVIEFTGERVFERTITCTNMFACKMHLEYLRKEMLKNGNEKEN